MNMNPFPRGFEDATERNPLPRWAAWLAAVLIFAGYGALEALDAHTEALIVQVDAARPIAQASQPPH